MRIAALADVHGNLLALEAVLADLASLDVDVTVDLGDLVSGGVQPRETAERLLALGLPTVRGNHERQLATTPPEQLGASDRLAYDALGAEQLAELAALPTTLRLADGVLACHATPTDDVTYLLETVDPTGARAATPEEVADRLGAWAGERLVLCGHTHLQRALQLPDGALVVNPGSVGWAAFEDDRPHPHAMQAGTPHARYAVLDDASGRWEATFRALEYDWERAARLAEGNDRPDVARALRTGSVLRGHPEA